MSLVNENNDNGQVLALDILPIDSLPGVTSLTVDIYDENIIQILKDNLKRPKVDLVLSDMAPSTTGHKSTDHLRIISLLENALDIAEEVLDEGGCFIGKVFRGGTESEILNRMKKSFETVKHVKPKSSRSNSTELYVIGLNFRKSFN